MRLMREKLLLILLTTFAWCGYAVAEDESEAAYVGYIELKPFVTNFDGGDQLRFLKAEVTLQVDE